jgi:hypothetical protein
MKPVVSSGTVSSAVLGAVIGLLAAGCSEPQPRSFDEYLEDRMLMEGTLARCNADRYGTHDDLECANARRAAVTIALRVEEARREELERESERKLMELRVELARREQAEREALAAAEAAKQAAYEALWRDGTPPVDGAPLPGGAAEATNGEVEAANGAELDPSTAPVASAAAAE